MFPLLTPPFSFDLPPPPHSIIFIYPPINMNEKTHRPTVALDSLGCKLNQAEIQSLARQFEAAGYRLVDPDAKADIYVLNTCSVTHVADRKSRHLLRLARRRNPAARLIAIGCYAHRAPDELSKIEGVELVLGNDRKMNLLESVDRFRQPTSKWSRSLRPSCCPPHPRLPENPGWL